MIELLLFVISCILFPPLLGLLTFRGGLGLLIAGSAGVGWAGYSLFNEFGWPFIQLTAAVMVAFYFLCKRYQRIETENTFVKAASDERTDTQLRLKELDSLIKRSEAATRVKEQRSSLRWHAALEYNKHLTKLGHNLRRLLRRELNAEFHSRRLDSRLQEQQELQTKLTELEKVSA